MEFFIVLIGLVVLILLLGPILHIILACTLLTCCAITSCIIFASMIKHIKQRNVIKIINKLTTKQSLDILPIDVKRQLASLIFAFLITKKMGSQFKKSLMNIALGYTVQNLGFDRVVRYGLGYVILRGYLKKHTTLYDKEPKEYGQK